MVDSNNFSQLLRARRLELGLSLRDLEAQARINRGTLANFESGKRRPGLDDLNRLSGPLETPQRELALAVGYPIGALPSIQPYLRSAYGLDAAAAADVAAYLESHYGALEDPADGEDELPE